MSSETTDYSLGTNSSASARLNIQHYWTQLTCGYLLHPDIKVDAHAKIADIATGTGIWPIALSRALPSTVQFDGFDITDAQFPPGEWLPGNVTLGTMNILEPVPEHLRASYDIVNIRYFGLLIKNNDHVELLRNLVSLLKPGGYLQWIEADVVGQIVVSTTAQEAASTSTQKFAENGAKYLRSLGFSYDWLRELPTSCQKVGLVRVSQFEPENVAALRPIFSFASINGWEELSHTILDRYGPNAILGSGAELRERIYETRREVEKGVALQQKLYVTIAQRPV